MTITVTKSKSSLREALNALRKKTGLFGERILSSATAQDFYNVVGLSRNLLLNGDFKIWQRGTTQNKGGDSYTYVGPDQVVCYYNGSYDRTQITLPDKTVTYALRNTLGSSTQAPNLSFPIENGGSFLRNKTVTASWWMRASKSRFLRSRFNSIAQGNYGGAGYTLMNPLITHQVDTDWQYFTRTFTFPGTMSYAHVSFELFGDTIDWAPSDWFEIARIQVELGNTASPFEYRNEATELAMCQRYFEVIDARSTLVFAWASEPVRQQLQFNVQKRATPSASPQFSSLTNIQYGGYTAPGASVIDIDTRRVLMSYGNPSTWVAQGGAGYINVTNTGSSLIYISAEV